MTKYHGEVKVNNGKKRGKKTNLTAYTKVQFEFEFLASEKKDTFTTASMMKDTRI